MSNSKKLVSVIVPIFNEVLMVDEIYDRIKEVFVNIESYEYEIVFFDDGSTDGTCEEIEKLCAKDNKVKAVFYSRNFGYLKNTFYCMQQAKGDCAIVIHADLQNPPELIPEFLAKWETGKQVVLGVKNKSRENKFIYFLRTVFYFLITKVFGVDLIPHATEFELFDKSFIKILKDIKTNNPFLRGIVNEYASSIDCVYYTQEARKKGNSKFNIKKYYEFAICGITQYSVCIPRRIILTCVFAFVLLFAEFCFVMFPDIIRLGLTYVADSLVIRCMLAVMLFLLMVVSLVFEYVIAIKNNNVEKPFVVEKTRINY